MVRDIELIKKDLQTFSTSFFITKWIFEHTPYIFDDRESDYILWREGIAEKMRVDTSDILITGSACLGFSLSPHKNFKVFNDRSDIDVSIVSQHYFDVAWHDLINISRPIIAANMKEAIDDHRQRLIYWGTIATDRILPLLSFGKEWDNIINKNRFHSPLDDRNINFRVYKDKLAIRNYLSLSVKDRKNALLEAQAK